MEKQTRAGGSRRVTGGLLKAGFQNLSLYNYHEEKCLPAVSLICYFLLSKSPTYICHVDCKLIVSFCRSHRSAITLW